ncbi:DUF4382 domain-containing protein [Leptothermofonsia sp. ETS-13]|uniref:DUF4382 domain-containing protein n=1 Tax=Leptothermofonsia sp. ETS-13 TaxID=3035696 RepID=UPI003BA37689
MKKFLATLAGIGLIASGTVQGCSGNQPASIQSPGTGSPAATTEAADTGTLEIRANGEDFVRQGFTSKDGWKISFENVYTTLSNITAYQTEPPYDPQKDQDLKAKQQVKLDQTQTVDLAAGDERAEPVLVGEVNAPAGRYNALSWRMVKPADGPAKGYPLLLKGKATKDGKTVDFTLRIDQEMAFSCGDFVGDDRKGLLKPGDKADLEATFHFDHLFGDADVPMDDDLNKQALGFEPLAAIARNGKLDVDMAGLKQQLSLEDFKKLESIFPSLGHVGEGHCKETLTQA